MQTDISKGLFAGFVALFIVGFFVGLPIVVWLLLIPAFVAFMVATNKIRKAENERTPYNPNDRPWRK